ncbi:MAG: peptide transporter ATP-binding protein [Peptococcaceae bacterium]|nr:peptide transporter ATP-binding protein [Peptococcaceae bacterium]
MKNILEVQNLQTSFFTHVGEVKAVGGVSFQVGVGEAIGIVGESGCGKSVTSLSIMRLLTYPGQIVGGSINFAGKDLVKATEKEMQRIRGNEISMIFQDPMTSLNPVFTIGNQIMEPLMRHQKLSRSEAKAKAIEMLRLVGIPSPEKRAAQYPHEFSGGMRQRVMIAMALSCQPKLLIADEPTTALDVTIQAQILELMKELKEKINTSIILITHDLGVVAEVCSRIIVMYAGIIVEQGTREDIFYNPRHPYTWGLLKSIPHIEAEKKERLIPIDGQPPDLLKPPAGCPFYPRCEHAMEICVEQRPPYTDLSPVHKAACWLLHYNAPKVERGN